MNENIVNTMILSSIIHQQYKIKVNQQDNNADYMQNKLFGDNNINIYPNSTNDKLIISADSTIRQSEITPATLTYAGVVKIGNNINLNSNNGIISVSSAEYNKVGLIKIGNNISVNSRNNIFKFQCY